MGGSGRTQSSKTRFRITIYHERLVHPNASSGVKILFVEMDHLTRTGSFLFIWADRDAHCCPFQASRCDVSMVTKASGLHRAQSDELSSQTTESGAITASNAISDCTNGKTQFDAAMNTTRLHLARPLHTIAESTRFTDPYQATELTSYCCLPVLVFSVIPSRKAPQQGAGLCSLFPAAGV